MITDKDLTQVVKVNSEFAFIFLSLQRLNLINFEPWRVFSSIDEINSLQSGLYNRYPSRMVFPVARRDDTDDIICLIIDSTSEVRGQLILIHDFVSVGWEVSRTFSEISEWFYFMVNEFLDLQNFLIQEAKDPAISDGL